MDKELKTTFSVKRVFNCTYSLIIDKRHSSKSGLMPICVRFNINRKMYYWKVDVMTESDFDVVCGLTAKSHRNALYGKYEQFNQVMKGCEDTLKEIGEINLSLARIKTELEGHSTLDKTFMSIWQEMIAQYEKQNDFNTARFYTRALNHFTKSLCKGKTDKEPITGFCISRHEIEKWIECMDNGMQSNGNVLKPISETTKGIYLRHLRAVWNECKRQGYLLGVDYPFSNKKNTKKISIPTGNDRKHEYLNVAKMTTLYNTFVNRDYPNNWTECRRKGVHYSLGLFLFQYLGNGMNLADVAQLTYDDFYFNSDRTAFRFFRQKTRKRCKDESEVIVPITEALRNVIDGIAMLNDNRDVYVINSHILAQHLLHFGQKPK